MSKIFEKLNFEFNNTMEFTDQIFRFIHERDLIPYAIDTEREGSIVHTVKKVGENVSASSLGSLNMPFHTEVPQEDNNPDYTLIVCVTGQEGVFTDVVELDLVIEQMDWTYVNVLMNEDVLIVPNASFKDQQEKAIKMLYLDEFKNICVRGNLAHLKASTGMGYKALQDFRRCLHGTFKHEIEFTQKGQAVLMDNKRTMHNRRGFEANPDRELKRIYLKKLH